MTKVAASVLVIIVMAVLALNATYVPTTVPKFCVKDEEEETKLRGMMFEALDQAFKEHIGHLFDIWVKEQAETPERAVAGAQIGASAYVRAHRSAVNWTPLRCK